MRTESDRHGDESTDRRRGETPVLYLGFRANDPMTLPSRHVIADIDVISFGRGDESVTRDRKDGLRRLVVRVPDPLMSSQHGQLVRARGFWVLDDPCSKNGALVGGVRTRSSAVEMGQPFSLGHTLFFLAREGMGDRGPLDVAGPDLAAPLPELATFDPSFAAALVRMARVATTDLPILLLGETGTGKEVTARALHELSRRRGPFVAVNCGGLAASLVEAELFGHRRGAFSGAVADRPGYVRTADGGTLFLDEVGDLPLPAQAALLRVLQEREVVPVGESMPVPVDLRVCAATHRDLEALVASGAFREDLHARLRGLIVALPPLRARRADLGLLVPALLRRQARRDGVRFTPAVASLLYTYRWPRNVRELAHALGIMAALAGGKPIGLEHVPEDIRAAESPRRSHARVESAAEMPVEAAPLSGEELELKQKLESLLREHGDNLAEVARKLGKDRTQIYRWVRRLGIPRNPIS